MAWSGDCSDYEEDDDGEATGTDIDDLPDEELIVVLRDEQNSIKEAQRLIHKEIKSIRRELKRLLRQYATSQSADNHPHGITADMSVDSGLSETNYVTDNTPSEVASSHGDSEAGYQDVVEYDTDESAGHLRKDGRYRRKSSAINEVGTEYVTEMKNPNEDHEGIEGSVHARVQNGFRPGYGLPPQWGNGETNLPVEDHTRGRNSTYEDAYIMMRRRHSQKDMPEGENKPKSAGNRWKSMIHKHGKSIYSISESDKNLEHLDNPSPPLKEHMSRQSSEDELGHLQDFSEHRHNNRDPYRRYSTPGIQAKQTGEQNHRKKKRSQSAQLINVKSDVQIEPIKTDVEDPWSTMPVLKKTQASQFLLKPKCRTEVPHERPPSTASDGSDQNLPLRQLDAYGRMQTLGSDDESRHSPRFSDSSYDSYISMDSQGFARSSHSSSGSPRQRDYSKHHNPIDVNLPKILTRRQSSPISSPTKATNIGSKHTHPQEAYIDSCVDSATSRYSHQKHHSVALAKQRAKFLRDVGRSSSQPLMNVHGLMSSVP